MPRYLTPSKIALLALISVYVEGHVSIAASVSVLSFLLPDLLPNPKDTSADAKPSRSIQNFQDSLSKLPSDFPGRTVWDLVLRKLWTFNCLDELHAFFDTLPKLMAKTRPELLEDQANGRLPQDDASIRISSHSPLGIFVRRACVEFFRLQMEDCILLWKSLLQFREPTRSMIRRRNPSVSKTGFDCNISLDGSVYEVLYGDLTNGRFEGSSTSTADIEALIAFYVEKTHQSGQRMSPQMEDELEHTMKLAAEAPIGVSFLKYGNSLEHNLTDSSRHLEAWKAGDFPSAYDNFHRYFDYTMQKQERKMYQFALLNLASLHVDFGAYSEAMFAIREAISVAREHKDIPCLNHALSWLFNFSRQYPEATEHARKTGIPGTDKEALGFLKAKARDSEMWGLLSLSYLTEARCVGQSGDGIALAFESIAKASHLNLVKENSRYGGAELNTQSALFSRLGQRHLARMSAEVFMTCYASEYPALDLLNLTLRSAFMEAAQGHYTQAFADLDMVGPSIPRIEKLQQSWIACNILIKFRHSIAKYVEASRFDSRTNISRMEFVAADHLLTQLQANAVDDPELSYSILCCAVELEMRRGHLETAMKMIDGQTSSTGAGDRDGDRVINLMILKARIFAKAGLPLKGFSLSLRAAALSHQTRQLCLLWKAIGALSKALCSLSEFGAAVQLLKAIIPEVLESGDGELMAESYSYLADAYMGLAGEVQDGSSRRKEQMNKVLECLDRAFDEFSRLDDVQGQCETLAKKAVIMHLNGDLVLANDIASKYLEIKKSAGEENHEATQIAKP